MLFRCFMHMKLMDGSNASEFYVYFHDFQYSADIVEKGGGDSR